MKGFSLSPDQEARLRVELRQPTSAQVYRRAAALLALHEGRSLQDIATILGVTRQTIYNWLSCRVQGSSDLQLEDAPRAGRPSLWTEELDRRFDQALQRPPQELGYLAAHWTAPLLRRHLSLVSGLSVSDETIRRKLRRSGYQGSRVGALRQLESNPRQPAPDPGTSAPREPAREDRAIAA